MRIAHELVHVGQFSRLGYVGFNVSNRERMAFKFRIIMQVCLSASLGGCFPQSRPANYLKFKELPVAKQHCEFKKLSIDKQIDYYLFDRSREPPDFSFAYDIASQGAKVIPPVLKRLRDEPAEYRQVDLIRLLEFITTQYVDLKNDREVSNTIEEIVAKMNDPDWKRMAEKSLAAIKEGLFSLTDRVLIL